MPGKSRDADSTPYFQGLLNGHGGSESGHDAFEYLCQKGCDRNTVGGLFVFLTQTRPLVLKPDRKRARPKNIQIHLGALDTQDALGRLSLRQLRGISKRAKRLAGEISRLRKTPLVRHLVAQGTFGPADLLSGSPIGFGPAEFEGILNLPELAKVLGTKQRPEYTRRLRAIYKHIHERTGHWYDAKVADIIEALSPGALLTEKDLEQWRRRHKLTD